VLRQPQRSWYRRSLHLPGVPELAELARRAKQAELDKQATVVGRYLRP